MQEQLDPGHILEVATAFWPSKVLLTAIEFDLFTILASESMTADELGKKLQIQPERTFDFFDTLVALKFLERDGDGPDSRYRNTPQTAAFLDSRSPMYIGGLPKMLNTRLFAYWNDLGEALRTGQPQNELKTHGTSIFEELYANEHQLREFLHAMSAAQAGSFHALAAKFDFSQYKTASDIGGAIGLCSVVIAQQHSHLQLKTFDLPPVAPHAQAFVDGSGLGSRIQVVPGDFFADELPKSDVILMGNILHDWSLERKKILVKKAYDALPKGGAFIAIENVIDDARRENVFGMLMSLNMLIETGDGFDYTGAEFRSWCSEAGFKRFDLIRLAGPTSAAIAYK